MSTTGIKKNHFFLHFFCFFYLFFRILFAFFFYGKPAQRKTYGKGRTERRAEQQEARCAEITPAPVWNGATRTGSRTAADGKTAPIKKAPPCGGKAFLNEKKLRASRRTEPLAGRGTPVGDFRLRPDKYKNKKYWLRTVFKK